MKFAIKFIWQYLPHLRHIATLPWEIKNSNFLQIWKKKQTNCTLIACNFVIYWHILIFSVFKIANLSPYWLQINFPCHFWFTRLLLRSICGIGNLPKQTSLQCLSTINMVLSDKDKILINSLYLKGYTAKRLTGEFLEKSWTKRGVNKLLKKLLDKLTGTVDRRPGSGRPCSARTEENAKLLISSEVPAVCHWLYSADCQVKRPRTPFRA